MPRLPLKFWCLLCVLLATVHVSGCGDSSSTGGTAPAEQGSGDPWAVQSHKISQTEGGFSGALADFDNFGFAVTAIGDLDRDGTNDLAVGAPWDENPDTGAAAGAVWILFMNPDLTVRSQVKISPGSAGFETGAADGGRFGYSLAGIGDVDGDGIADIAVGAPYMGSRNGEQRGSVWILLLQRDGSVKASHEIVPDSFGDPADWERTALFGLSIAGVGDIDGDGAPDLAVAGNDPGFDATTPDVSGVRIVFLDTTGTATRVRLLDQLWPSRFSVARAGDVNGDGIGDLVVSPAGGGPIAVFLNRDGTAKAVHDVHGNYPSNEDPWRYNLSESVANVGDLDGDGIAEVAMLSTSTGASTDTAKRNIFLYYFNRQGDFRTLRRLADRVALAKAATISGVGDIDGDGRPEVAIGAPSDNDGGRGRGAIWLLSISDPSAATTTSTVAATTTSSVTTTTCPLDICGPQDGPLWNVEIHLDAPTPITSLDFLIDYSAAPGFFVGSGGDVECTTNSGLNIMTAFNDCDPGWCGERALRGGMISVPGVDGPALLATCTFRSVEGTPVPDDFAITVIHATQPNERETNASVSVVVTADPSK